MIYSVIVKISTSSGRFFIVQKKSEAVEIKLLAVGLMGAIVFTDYSHDAQKN